jgi:hypothetical protein
MVHPTGVEPVAYSSGGCRSIQTELRVQKVPKSVLTIPETKAHQDLERNVGGKTT